MEDTILLKEQFMTEQRLSQMWPTVYAVHVILIEAALVLPNLRLLDSDSPTAACYRILFFSDSDHCLQKPTFFCLSSVPCALFVKMTTSLGDANPFSAVRTAGTIHSLPDDVLLLIISFVDVRDILALRKTSKRLYSMTKLRWVWSDAMKRHVIDKGLPVPAADADIKAFSAEHLEARAVHAARFHENWCSPAPRPRRTLEFNADRTLPEELPEQHRGTIDKVLFLAGRNGEFLVTVTGRVITCWEVPLDGSGAYRVAEWISGKRVEQVIANEDPKSEAVLAFVTGEAAEQHIVEVTTLSLDKFHGRFAMQSKLRGFRHTVLPLHTMQCDYLVFGDPLLAWFCKPPVECKTLTKLPMSLFPDESNKILAVRPVHRYMVVVREHAIQIVYAPLWNGERAHYAGNISACVHMDYGAKSASIIVRTPSGEESADWPSEPVTILLRCCPEDGFNTLRQLDLLPVPRAQRMQESGSSTGQKKGIFDPPCILPPGETKSFVVAPSACKLQVGPSGKGFWIQTRNVTSRHSMYPARCLSGFYVTTASERSTDDDDLKQKDEVQEIERPITHPYAKGGNELHLCGTLWSRRCRYERDSLEEVFDYDSGAGRHRWADCGWRPDWAGGGVRFRV
ncbi:hypothetical protein B0H21DRAFT_741288, partial [Amylocystis lapponica]